MQKIRYRLGAVAASLAPYHRWWWWLGGVAVCSTSCCQAAIGHARRSIIAIPESPVSRQGFFLEGVAKAAELFVNSVERRWPEGPLPL
jgi:hypothetical protein